MILSVRNLSVHFSVVQRGLLLRRNVGTVKAVDNVSFEVREGETLGLVGESGCGKSTLGRALLQLTRPTGGKVVFQGVELTGLWKKSWAARRWTWGRELRELRREMQMVFQDPYASLDPRMTAEEIIAEPLRAFDIGSGRERRARVAELMERVGLDPRYVRRFPHEFSGGQKQRIGIARALALKPALIVADEPVSALDVSIRAQILNLLRDLQKDLGLTLIFIAHDLAAVRHVSDRVAVMYLGKIVEVADSAKLYDDPQHPYTEALLSAIPVPDPRIERGRERKKLKGEAAGALAPPSGCAFHPRCLVGFKRCEAEAPPVFVQADGSQSACWLSEAPAITD